ncbi:MAG: hypothetical protein GQ557_01225 [Mycoplasmataceae bacterium]|nr:hypothetical protein [Mycoplasmataceae bacterium]
MSINDEPRFPSSEPIQARVIDLNLGGNSSAITLDTTDDGMADTLYMWGNNEFGQLGLGDKINYNTPQEVTFSAGTTIVDFEQGSKFSGAAVDTTGDSNADTLYMWGANESGQLGLGASYQDDFYNTPQEVTFLPEGTIIDLAFGSVSSGVTIDTTGDGMADTLYTWGDNLKGALGLGNSVNYDTPQEVTALPEGELTDFEMGFHHSGTIIDTTGDGKADSLYTWGSDYYGQLGNGSADGGSIVDIPEEITIDSTGDFINLTFGVYNSAITLDTTEDGKADSIFVWGNNDLGQLGLDNNFITDSPTELTTLPAGTIIDFEMGSHHSGATIDTTGDGKADSTYMWGSNDLGQLGLGNDTSYDTPQEIDMNGVGTPAGLQLGNFYTGLMIDTTGDGNANALYMWGANESGQLGLGDEIDYDTPQNIGVDLETPQTSPSAHDTAIVNNIDTTLATINYSFSAGNDEFGVPYEVTEITLSGTGITDNYAVESPSAATGKIILQDLDPATNYNDLIVQATFSDGNTYNQDVNEFTTIALTPINPVPNDTATVSDIIDTEATINYSFSSGSDVFGDPYEVTEITLSGTGITNNYTVTSPTEPTGTITLQNLDAETNYNDLIVLMTFTDGNTYEQSVDPFVTLSTITSPNPDNTASVSNIIDTEATINYSFSPGNDEFGAPYEIIEITLSGTGITNNYTVESPSAVTGTITLQDLEPETNYDDLIIQASFTDGNTYEQGVDSFTTQELIIPASPNTVKWIIISVALIILIVFLIILMLFLKKIIKNNKKEKIN